jgi:hypothetical protein
MSDRTQSTPEPNSQAWQELTPFREAFLRYFTAPGDAEAFRRTGSVLFEMTLDYCRVWPKPEESETISELRAIIEDLRYTEHQLRRNVAESLATCQLEGLETHLALMAKGWIDRLAAITTEIEQATAV